MKFRAAFVAILTFFSVATAAAQTGNVAVGPVYSIDVLEISSPLHGLGITGKVPGLAPVFGLNFQIPTAAGTPFFLGVTADWLLYKQPIYEPLNLGFYLGPGFYTSLYLADSASRFDLGLRIPVGFNWVPLRFFELFLEVTPAFGITFTNPVAPSWLLQGGAGARVWF